MVMVVVIIIVKFIIVIIIIISVIIADDTIVIVNVTFSSRIKYLCYTSHPLLLVTLKSFEITSGFGSLVWIGIRISSDMSYAKHCTLTKHLIKFQLKLNSSLS